MFHRMFHDGHGTSVHRRSSINTNFETFFHDILAYYSVYFVLEKVLRLSRSFDVLLTESVDSIGFVAIYGTSIGLKKDIDRVKKDIDK